MPRGNINNWYADDKTLQAESEEELNILLMKVKEESEKAGLKLNFQKMKTMASGPVTSQQIEVEKVKEWQIFLFLGFKITVDNDSRYEIERHVCFMAGKLWQT